ncbi:MAG TPA: NlpC/P60 family protein, partial [Chloroflexota bacterium]|nr:NlpC/P60 family protein [Chloroflexota bacterium]
MRRFLLAVVVCAAVACGPAVPWAAHSSARDGQTRAAVERAVAALAERGSAWPGTEGGDDGWLPADYTLTIARDGSWTLDETVVPEIDPLLAPMGNQAPPAAGGATAGWSLFPGLRPVVPIALPVAPAVRDAPAAPAASPVRAEGKAPMVQIRANGPAAITMDQILANAKRLVGVPYVWGGNSESGLDCSAYVSKAWGVGRYTTDSIAAVSFKIPKDELLPGDIMNLTTREDPGGYGHVRLFAGWANADRTRMWVYEETPPRS